MNLAVDFALPCGPNREKSLPTIDGSRRATSVA